MLFLSSYTSRIDDKGRVSVPASFRSTIESKGENLVYAYASFVNECIEVCTSDRIEYLEKMINDLELFSTDKDVMATAILSGCEPLQIDAKGRINLSERLLKSVGVDKDLMFVGKGKTFEIWNKIRFAEYYQKAREIARSKSIILK